MENELQLEERQKTIKIISQQIKELKEELEELKMSKAAQ